MNKTNAMRLLDAARINYNAVEYEVDENDLSGIHIANQLGQDKECVFKTLVTRSNNGVYTVFCIPVAEELDLKKCAAASGHKSVEMIAVKELLPVTGYIRGGCSPIGMKKPFATYIDETAMLFDKIFVSGGKRGTQICISPENLIDFIGGKYADLVK